MEELVEHFIEVRLFYKEKINMTKQLTMEETLELLVTEGIGKHEKQLERVKKVGKLANKKQVEAVERSLEQLYENFTIEKGTGKSAVVHLGKKREQIAERVDGRENNGGYNLGETGNMLVDIVYQNLKSVVEEEGNEFTKRVWAELLGFPSYDDSAYGKDHKKFVSMIDSAYNVVGADFYKPNDLVREFIYDYNSKSQTFVLQAFTRLEKQGKIEYIVKYKGVKNNSHKDIEEKVYNGFKSMNNELIKQSGYTRPQYNNFYKRMLDFQRLSEEQQAKVENREKKALAIFIETYEEMQEKLVEEFDVEYVYEMHKVELDGEYEVNDPMHESVLKTYFDDEFLIRTKSNRYDNYKEHFAESSYFWRAFYYLSASILLDRTDKEVMERFEDDLKAYVMRYDLEYGLQKRHEFMFLSKEERIQLIKEERRELFKKRELKRWAKQREIQRSVERYYDELNQKELEEIQNKNNSELIQSVQGVNKEWKQSNYVDEFMAEIDDLFNQK